VEKAALVEESAPLTPIEASALNTAPITPPSGGGDPLLDAKDEALAAAPEVLLCSAKIVDKADKERPELAIELTLIEDSYGDRRTVDGGWKNHTD
jgi:hypothetical protein